jgi:O-antigen/teichoic acid export membrane protein
MVIEYLGQGVYANLGVMFSIVGFVGTISNAFTSSAARYLTQSIAKNDTIEASSYMSSSVGAIVVYSMAIGTVVLLIQFTYPGTFGNIPLGVMFVFLSGVLFNAIAGVCRSTNFATERFASSSLVYICSRILYVFLVICFLLYTPFGVWGIALSFWASGLFLVVVSVGLSRNILPSVKFSIGSCAPCKIKEMSVFAGWTILVYCGLYLSGSCIQIAVNHWLNNDTQLFRFVLAFQIGTMAYQLLNSLSIITSPGIYQALAREEYKRASSLVERSFFLTTISALFGIILIYFEGENLLHIWLSEFAPKEIILATIGIIVAFSVSCLSVGLHVFLSGSNQIRSYGLITFLEGLFGITAVIIWLEIAKLFSVDSIGYIGWILAVVSFFKIIYTIVKFNHILLLRPLKTYLKKFGQICLCLAGALGLYISQSFFFPQSYQWIPVRCLILAFPFVVLLLYPFLKNDGKLKN